MNSKLVLPSVACLLIALAGCRGGGGMHSGSRGGHTTGVSVEREILKKGNSLVTSNLYELAVEDPSLASRTFDILLGAESGTSESKTVDMPSDLTPGAPMAPTQQVLKGWGVFAGSRPLGKGRRVRVHGSGTQFIIQCQLGASGWEERAYIIAEPLTYIQVTLENNAAQPPVQLNGTGDFYVEVLNGAGPGGTDILGPVLPVPPANILPISPIRVFFDSVVQQARAAGVIP